MNDVLHFNIRDVGVFNSVPWIARTTISYIFAYVIDRFIIRDKISVTHARKLAVFIGKRIDVRSTNIE